MATRGALLARGLVHAATPPRVPASLLLSSLPWGGAPLAAHATCRLHSTVLATVPGGATETLRGAANIATVVSAGGAAPADSGGRALKYLSVGSVFAGLKADRDMQFHADKAAFIPALESAGKVVALLRPQGWGKTLFLNMLRAYYDCARAAAPLVRVPSGDTALAHSFAILRFGLETINGTTRYSTSDDDKVAVVEAALDALVFRCVQSFIARYRVPAGVLTAPKDPMRCLEDVCTWAKERGTPVYVLVDDYDAPLREAAICAGTHGVAPLTRGPLRAFYARFKELVDGELVSRIFLTGTVLARCATHPHVPPLLPHSRVPLSRTCRYLAAGARGHDGRVQHREGRVTGPQV